MKYGLGLIVLVAMLVTASPVLADFMVIDDFCGMGQLCVGLKERIRTETMDNAFSLDSTATGDRRHYFRTRSQLYADWKISDFDKVRIQLTNEFRNWLIPDGRRGNMHEAVFDNFYVDSKEIFESPVSVSIGRMDLLGQYGEMFLFADGTPADGSRTFYFDMVRASIEVNEQNKVDVLYISNDKKDKKLPRFNKQDSTADTTKFQDVNKTNDSGPALILKSKLSDELYAEPYFVYKEEELSDTRKHKLSTVGSYLRYKAADFTVRGQLAFQFGDYSNAANTTQDWDAFGGFVFVDKPMQDWALSPVFSAGMVYLSGNDPASNKMEGWNPLYSRFPNWNELYCYILIKETAGPNGVAGGGGTPAYWTNTMMYTLRTKLKVNPQFSADLALDFFMAPEKRQGIAGFGTGSNKGFSPHTTLTYAFSKTVVGRWQFFYFAPGNFYAKGADNAFFTRTELSISF